jgi:malonyl-CoA O-methyltransferase
MGANRGLFVTGTDTGVGKTIVAACLVRRLRARYWKPIQTGLAEEDGDTVTVTRLAELHAERAHMPRHQFLAPLSPEAAASREGVHIRLDDFTLPEGSGPVIVEGAGGVLVPLGGGAMMTDLMQRLGLPVVLVARSALGTINHTLLSIEALRARQIPIRGVVMAGPAPAENADAIARHGKVPILAMLPWLDRLDAATLAGQAASFRGDLA